MGVGIGECVLGAQARASGYTSSREVVSETIYAVAGAAVVRGLGVEPLRTEQNALAGSDIGVGVGGAGTAGQAHTVVGVVVAELPGAAFGHTGLVGCVCEFLGEVEATSHTVS